MTERIPLLSNFRASIVSSCCVQILRVNTVKKNIQTTITVFTLIIGTILVLKFEIVHTTTFFMFLKYCYLIRHRVLWRLIWVYTVCKGLFVPILRLIKVQLLYQTNIWFTFTGQTFKTSAAVHLGGSVGCASDW